MIHMGTRFKLLARTMLLAALAPILVSGCGGEKDSEYALEVFPTNPIVLNVDVYNGEELVCAKPWTFFDFSLTNNSDQTITIIALKVIGVGKNKGYEAGCVFGTVSCPTAAPSIAAAGVFAGGLGCVQGLNIDQKALESDVAIGTFEAQMIGYTGSAGCTKAQEEAGTCKRPDERVLARKQFTTR